MAESSWVLVTTDVRPYGYLWGLLGRWARVSDLETGAELGRAQVRKVSVLAAGHTEIEFAADRDYDVAAIEMQLLGRS